MKLGKVSKIIKKYKVIGFKKTFFISFLNIVTPFYPLTMYQKMAMVAWLVMENPIHFLKPTLNYKLRYFF